MLLLNKKIKFENNEINSLFRGKDKEREIPLFIQNTIIDLIYNEIKTERTSKDLKKSLEQIDKNIVNNVINSIDNMYKNIEKTDYSNKHIEYIWYYLPNNIYKVWQPLIDLAVAGELKTEIDLLDIGTGPASLPIGFIEFYSKIAQYFKGVKFKLNIYMVDAQPKFLYFASCLIKNIINEVPKNLEIYFQTDCKFIGQDTNLNFGKKFDIISMSNFINHFEHQSAVSMKKFVEGLKNILNDDGSIIFIEPGSKDECKDMKELRNILVNNNIYNIFSPCVSIWEEKKLFDCICFTTYSMPIKKPELIEFLIENGLRKQKKEHVSFNYMILRTDGIRKYKIERNKQSFSLIKDIFQMQDGENRVNIKGVVRKKTVKNKSFCVCDGSCIAQEIWINIENDADDAVKEFDILNMGEKVNIKKMKVIKQRDRITLVLDKKSKLEVYF